MYFTLLICLVLINAFLIAFRARAEEGKTVRRRFPEEKDLDQVLPRETTAGQAWETSISALRTGVERSGGPG